MNRFDAVLLIAFGGPQGLDDVRPFLNNVLRGRNVPATRVAQVAQHYELFAGVSPITTLTQRQADGLQQRLAASDLPLPVYIGMRNWHPFLADSMAEMSRAGVRRAVGVIMAPQASFSSCEQYRENVLDARSQLRDAGLRDIEITYVPGWHTHHQFIAANAAQVREALECLPAELRRKAQLIFTAHSIPTRMAERSQYREQLGDSSRAVATAVGITDWALVYQSRSGHPRDPWLEPDINDHLRAARAAGLAAAVICPIGFVCDHIEVLYDLDREAAATAAAIGLPLARAAAVNHHPYFLDLLSEAVTATVQRYRTGRPLQVVRV